MFIVSANSLHAPETITAAKSGKHVLVEKPMAMNTAEAMQMIEVCLDLVIAGASHWDAIGHGTPGD